MYLKYNKYMDNTKLAFAKALLQLLEHETLDKITVTQITRQANKTRQTFYRNFKDKEDLVNWYFEKLCLKSFKEMADTTTLSEALIKKFTFIKSESTFFKEAFKEDDYNSLTNYDYRCIYNFYKEKMKLDDETDFLLQMYCHGSIEMTKDWVKNNMPLDIPTFVKLLIESMPDRLKIAFNDKAKDTNKF